MNLTMPTLTGRTVRLEQLAEMHLGDLLSAACHPEIWIYLDEPVPQTSADIRRLYEDAMCEQAQGKRMPWAIVDSASGRAVGSTSFINIRPNDRAVEIGWIWLTPAMWGTGAARECLRLQLGHAIDTMGAVRVAYKADARNIRSLRSIEAAGVVREGVFRNHRILSDGYIRDSVYYSVIPNEWPAVRDRLDEMLAEADDPRPNV
ncbi:GNAT family protein [Pilimelia columellifera]|uniref:GNAT family protein n=1 Tax=Pilimelia columellifera subsp. columellifera TaxID=706583 RepID=A0ABP6A685_9ACTN